MCWGVEEVRGRSVGGVGGGVEKCWGGVAKCVGGVGKCVGVWMEV